MSQVDMMLQFKHANIVSLAGYICQGNTLSLAVEHVSDSSLADCLRTGAIPSDDYLRLTLGIASGLAYLHGTMSFMHLDLTCRCVFVAGKTVKIGGFGESHVMRNRALYANTPGTVYVR
jgi:serine/threonine protein kinase